jgi:hypothetical protein
VSDARDEAAQLLDGVAEELRQSEAHVRVAAQHFRDREIPRACAHEWAARGHLLKALEGLDEQAREHSERSVTAADGPGAGS